MVSDHDDSYEDKKHRLQEFCAVPRTRQEIDYMYEKHEMDIVVFEETDTGNKMTFAA